MLENKNLDLIQQLLLKQTMCASLVDIWGVKEITVGYITWFLGHCSVHSQSSKENINHAHFKSNVLCLHILAETEIYHYQIFGWLLWHTWRNTQAGLGPCNACVYFLKNRRNNIKCSSVLCNVALIYNWESMKPPWWPNWSTCVDLIRQY